MLETAVHYAIDVGSVPKRNFAWACSTSPDCASSNLEDMARRIICDLQDGRRVSIGFECPLFWPCPHCTNNLGRQRDGDNGRGWAAGAGATVTPTGVQTMLWLLREIADARPGLSATTRWDEFRRGQADLLIWEAFASNKPKEMPHDKDAKDIVQAFLRWIEVGNGVPDIRAVHPVSLAGMAILWAGLSHDAGLLRQPCVAVKVNYDLKEC